MDLDTYLESVRRGVQNATALADEQTRSVAERLGATFDDAGKLALIAALSDAAAEISRDLPPGSVELRMSGTRPEFVVTPAPGQVTSDDHDDDDEQDDEPATDTVATDADEPTVRITLRLPASVKARVDESADAEGLSSNAWLMRTVLGALSGHHRGPRPPRPPRPPRGPLGPDGVFGPDGPFGPEGMFGPEGALGPKARDAWSGKGRGKGRGRGGKRVTGWAE